MSTIKTTINVEENLWRKFSIKVIEERGYRKKNNVIEELIEEYVKRKSV
jgi:metal-responsive CopG/Arc/MetJ family transcriptional regulator